MGVSFPSSQKKKKKSEKEAKDLIDPYFRGKKVEEILIEVIFE